jgi:hypothetical protein
MESALTPLVARILAMALMAVTGVIDNCVRSSDATKTWVTFLNRDPLAHKQWCDAVNSTRLAHHTPHLFVDEVNRGLGAACQ